MSLILTLKDKTEFPIEEMVFTKLYNSEETAYLIRVKCDESEDLQQLFYDVEKAFTTDNVSEVIVSVDDGSREPNTFNFTTVNSIDFDINDQRSLIEVSMN